MVRVSLNLFLCYISISIFVVANALYAYISPYSVRFQMKRFSAGDDFKSSSYMTCAEIANFSLCNGLILKPEISGMGQVLTIEAFVAGEEQLKPVGYLSAFIRPLQKKLLHLDTIQVKNRRQTLGFRRKGWTISGPGISFIMGSWALRWAYDQGCLETELLAVKDTEAMHRILMSLYSSFGFTRVRDVGDGMSSVPDRLVWGAVGTLMRMNLDSFLTEWTPKLAAMSVAEGSASGEE